MVVGQSRAQGGTVLVVLVGVLVGLRLAGPARGDLAVALTSPLRLVLLLVPAAVVLTSLHETAHAVVGRLVGWRVFGVTIGQGRRHATLHLGSVRIELRGLLVGGVTIARPTGHRTRDAVMLAAGVALETVVIAGVLMWSPDSAWAHSAKWAVIFVAAVDIVTNLWPRRVDVGTMTGLATDGAQLLSVIATPDQWRRDIEQMRWTPSTAELVQALHGGDVERALDLADAELATAPDDEVAVNLHGTLLLLCDRWHDAYERLAPLADRPDADPLVCNNAAWAAVMTFAPSLLPNADRWSQLAVESRPAEPACANTRGATLVLLGRADEALGLLETAADGRLSRQQKAYVLAFTALAHHRLGHVADARRRLTESETLDGGCPALAQVRRRLAVPPAPIAPSAALAAWPPLSPTTH